MTKQQAYQIMIELYQWEHDNPFKDYDQSPVFKKYKINKMRAHCAIAAFHEGCEECPASIDPRFFGCLPLTAIQFDCRFLKDEKRYKRICNIFINVFKMEVNNV